MPASQSSAADPLSNRALNRALLQRQALLQPLPDSALAMIERLGGLQAQAPNPPYLGLWSRLSGFRPEQLTELMQARQVVRATMMRGTLHLVTARDYLAWRATLQPMLRRLFLQSDQGRAVKDMDLDALSAAGRELLSAQPLNATDLGAALQAHWPQRDAGAMGRWVRGVEPLIHVPPAGVWDSHRAASFAPAAQWLGAPLAGDDASEAMVLRYLAAFGPASVQDIAAWSGLQGVRAIVERLRPRLRSYRDPSGTVLFDPLDAPSPEPERPAPPRLLADFDNVLLAHADRSRILDERHKAAVFTRNGIVRATVLIDGFVAGTWSLERGKEAATLTIATFARVSKADRVALETLAQDCLATFAPGLAPAVRFDIA
ncbi:winged helix DNA-binding domain-containing protein [Lysobacter sp. 5GHs7-4]|uniref:winged helix DNA-binding domain-containing protein n=1 Tax=Lysobacter sp. 5GHs7-4 TaxID=2904253 RepID=UPI001E603128|nr:winged helix DNA-binding domain-containing protein [Lysobacter sp. 5GHs7-4]UHQ22795.1 winged helix DNA-binding domain-containing protein [Lysobacter sp. 5GHs7-4]